MKSGGLPRDTNSESDDGRKGSALTLDLISVSASTLNRTTTVLSININISLSFFSPRSKQQTDNSSFLGCFGCYKDSKTSIAKGGYTSGLLSLRIIAIALLPERQ